MTFRFSGWTRTALCGAVAVGVLATASPSAGAVITVTTTADELNTDGDCSLREAVQAANGDIAMDGCPAGNGADTIVLPAGVFTVTPSNRDERPRYQQRPCSDRRGPRRHRDSGCRYSGHSHQAGRADRRRRRRCS